MPKENEKQKGQVKIVSCFLLLKTLDELHWYIAFNEFILMTS